MEKGMMGVYFYKKIKLKCFMLIELMILNTFLAADKICN